MSILPDALRDLEVGDFLSFGLVLFFIGTSLHSTFFYSMTISAGGTQVRFVIIIINIFVIIFNFLFFKTIFLFYYVFFFQIFRVFDIILNYIIDFLGTLNS